MITPEHSGVSSVRGEIPLGRNPAHLDQDILEVHLDNGIFIDVGWYPEHDQNGEFVIRVFMETWENQLLTNPIRTPDADEASEYVEHLANHYSGHLISVSLSSTLDLPVPARV